MPPTITRLREADVPAAAEMLSRAFYDDPLQIHTLPDPHERTQRSPALFTAALRYGLLFGEVLTNADGRPAGVAIWIGPDAWDITPERAAAAGFDQLPHTLGAEATDRFFTALAAAEPYHRRDVRPDHWWVMVLGVAPEAQGTGLARALLQPVMDRADAAGQQCYLETANPANITFYEHVGFARIADLVAEPSGIRFWTFRRG
jgi:GNAT superfamily N-acetyltransferase